MNTVGGYDKEVSDPKDDLLDRYRIANNIFNVIVDTPQKYSVRVGLYGEWGTGKTTILNFIEGIAREKEYIFIRFNPWSYNNQDELWVGFYTQLLQKLGSEGFDISDSIPGKIPKTIFKKILKKNLDNGLKAIDFFNEIQNQFDGKNFKPFYYLLSKIIDKNSSFHKAIIEKIGEKKIIVAFDDLDRTDPKLIAKLLLVLREILDLPNFAFILSMDREKVSGAISEYHPAYGTGHEFLEKIIDFPFFIPEPTLEQKENLFLMQLNEISDINKLINLDAIKNHFPNNPRRIKSIARIIKIMNHEILRHEETDVDWQLLVLSSIIKSESPQLFFKIIESFNDDEFIKPWYMESEKTKESDKREKLKLLLNSIKDIPDDGKNKLFELLESIFTRDNVFNKASTIYQLNLFENPSYLTWKEFKGLLEQWKTSKSLDHISEWVIKTAEVRKCNKNDVAQKLLETSIIFYSISMEKANLHETLEEYVDKISGSIELINFIEALFLSDGLVFGKNLFPNSNVFLKFLNAAAYWVYFSTDDIDKKIRRTEENSFLNILDSDFFDIETLYYFLHKQKKSFSPTGNGARENLNKLIQLLMKHIEKRAVDKILCIFETENSISNIELHESDNSISSYYLLNSSSPFFSQEQIKNIEKLVEVSKGNPIVYANLKKYFCHISDKINTMGICPQNSARINALAKITPILWQAVVQVPLQSRFSHLYLSRRKVLIECGISEDALSLPEWMTLEETNTAMA